MSKNNRTLNIFWTIIATVVVCLIINMPPILPVNIHFGKINWEHTFYRPPFEINFGNTHLKKNIDLKYGLDLAGGASIIFDIDTSKTTKENLPSALESLKGNIERRVNLFGISEATVQLSNQGDNHRLSVDLPGVENVDQAVALIGKTAQLSFKGENTKITEATTSATYEEAFSIDTGLNGSHLIKASPQPNPSTGEMEVSLEFNPEGTKLFEKATTQFLNKRIAIFLDNTPITSPKVQSVISEGKAVINGNFDTKSAKELSAQLNAGALPLSIKPIRQTTVGATLGQDSISKGVTAGLVGLGLVCLFMIGNYGYLGFIADIGLIIYGLLTLTLYRLIPVTLTFPGIVGFILSIGMAVDSNILIFERMREELRAGKPWNVSMELGFKMAWNSIRDANTCTIITGLILFNPFNWNFLNTSGMVRGFAVTLVLGILLGMFTGVVITRNLLRVLAHHKDQK